MRNSGRGFGIVVGLVASGLGFGFGARAADVPVPDQGPGEHSTVSTSDGSIRDDALADHICDAILAHQAGGGTGPSDVKIMLNSCYGGGVLDDIQRIFGPGGACAGIPWVGGSASTADKPAYGWKDATVNAPANNGKKLGSTWTDALAGTDVSPSDSTDGSILQGTGSDKVLDDLTQAGNLDDSGPNGDGLESPQVGSGNGGDQLEWAGGKHEAVVFGGNQTDQRHHNNVDKVTTALNNVWGTNPKNIQTLDGGTTQDLLDAITTAVGNLDFGTQLVIYIDDHGDTHFDINEYIDSLFTADPNAGGGVAFPLQEGWFEGLAGNALQGEPIAPTITFTPQSPFDSNDWNFGFNGQPLPLPPGIINGPVEIPIDWEFLGVGPTQNFFGVQPVVPGAPPPLTLEELQLNSGPINENDRDIDPFRMGPVQGTGCLPLPPDNFFGFPGGGAPVPQGVAATATHAGYQDSNNDGHIQVNCEATRIFVAQPTDFMVTDLQVIGDWAAPAPIDVTATYTTLIDQGGPPIVSVQNFAASNGGVLSGSAQSSPFQTGATDNTLRVQGQLEMDGPPGFVAEMHLVASIDGFVPEPGRVPALAAGIALVAMLGRMRRRA